MIYVYLLIGFFIGLFLILETTVINFPVIFLICACLLILVKKVPIYICVFIIALVLDALRVTDFGITPLFLLSIVTVIFIYEKFSGSDDLVIAGVVIAVAGYFYAQSLSYSTPLLLWFYVMCAVGVIGFKFLKKKNIYL